MTVLKFGSVDEHAKNELLSPLNVLTECSMKLEAEPFKGGMEQMVGVLLRSVEAHCREICVNIIKSLASEGETADICRDKLWTLRTLAKQSAAARSWMIEGGLLNVIPKSMLAHTQSHAVQKEGVWLCYVLCGMDGLVELMRRNSERHIVLQYCAWALWDLARKQTAKGQTGTKDWTQAETLVSLLLQSLNTNDLPEPLAWAACAALQVLVQDETRRGSLFIEQGGAHGILAALRSGKQLGARGDATIKVAFKLIATIVDGNVLAAQHLRAAGVLDAVVSCGICPLGSTTYETMWAIGRVGGIAAVLQIMSQTAASKQTMHIGLSVLAVLTWQEDAEEYLQEQVPETIGALLQLLQWAESTEGSLEDVVYSMQALGGVLKILCPHYPAGSGCSAVVDGMTALCKAVKPGTDEFVADAATASLGQIATHSPAWRPHLVAVLDDLCSRLRSPATVDKSTGAKHQKNLFSTVGVIAGLPVLVREMHAQPSTPHVQEAAMDTIVEILEDHIDDANSDDRTNTFDRVQVKHAIEIVTASMRTHWTLTTLQRAGCQALGLMCALLPCDEEFPEGVLDSVLAAFKWHPNDYKVASGVSSALRAFLEPQQGANTAIAARTVAKTAVAMRSKDVVSSCLGRVLVNYAQCNDKQLMENAFWVVGLLDGFGPILERLSESEAKQETLRIAGLKVLFELCRAFPDLLTAPQAAKIYTVATAMATEALSVSPVGGNADGCSFRRGAGSVSEENTELVRHAEMVCGLFVN